MGEKGGGGVGCPEYEPLFHIFSHYFGKVVLVGMIKNRVHFFLPRKICYTMQSPLFFVLLFFTEENPMPSLQLYLLMYLASHILDRKIHMRMSATGVEILLWPPLIFLTALPPPTPTSPYPFLP